LPAGNKKVLEAIEKQTILLLQDYKICMKNKNCTTQKLANDRPANATLHAVWKILKSVITSSSARALIKTEALCSRFAVTSLLSLSDSLCTTLSSYFLLSVSK